MAVQSGTGRSTLKWIAVTASIIWMSLTFYQEFLDADPDQYGFRSADVETQMKACGGTFQQRYDCKEAIIIAKGHASFLIWTQKTALILLPPIILALLVGRMGRQRPHDPLRSHLASRPTTPLQKRRMR